MYEMGLRGKMEGGGLACKYNFKDSFNIKTNKKVGKVEHVHRNQITKLFKMGGQVENLHRN